MTAAGTVDTGTVLADRWVLTRRVGTGASSHVYAARDPRLDRWVAVKVLHASLASDPAFLAQFGRETRAVSNLTADNVVRFYDADTHQLGDLRVPYIVTALMEGGSLAGILGTGRRLDVAQAIALARGAARGLRAAHHAGIVHSDVKPSNLLFDAQGRVALSDFGISRAIASATSTEPIGPASATTRYASPEQMQGRVLDGRSDVYSLALVVMESVTGVVPRLADTIAGTVALRSDGPMDISVDFGALREPLAAATEADPLRRCDAAELLALLAIAAERVDPPRPLELVSLEDLDDQTSEFEITDGAGLVVLPPMRSGTPSESDPPSEPDEGDREGTLDLTAHSAAVEPPGGERAETWTSDSIAAADEHARLAEAIPTNLGKVEPLDASDAPGAVAELPVAGKLPKGAKRGAGGRNSRRTWLVMALVLLILAGGAVATWWFALRVPTHEVPSLVGGDLTAAVAAAEENGWTTEIAGRTRVDGTVADEVLEQDPAAGTELAEGEALALVVSDGPTLTEVPQVAGLPEAEAVAALEAAGLSLGGRTTDFNEDAAAGVVLLFAPAEGLQPDADGRVPKGTAIDIIVSDGPAPRVVPGGLVGASRSDAEAALAAIQLTAEVSTDYSDTVAEGVVISAGVEPGTEVPRGSSVPLVVSDGPRPILVPDVVGQSGSAAAAALEAAGFTVSGIEGSPTGSVLATDPVAGESRPPGSSVRVFTRQ